MKKKKKVEKTDRERFVASARKSELHVVEHQALPPAIGAKKPCADCGGMATFQPFKMQFEYLKQTKEVEFNGWWCNACDTGVPFGDRSVLAKAEATFRAEIDHVLSPDEVFAIRQTLELSQYRAGELLGGGHHAFQKYESGAACCSIPMSNLLRLLANDPRRLKELASIRGLPRARRKRA